MQARTTATISSTAWAGIGTAGPGRDDGHRAVLLEAGELDGQVDATVGVAERRRDDESWARISARSRSLLLAGQPAELAGLTTELAAAALHERKHLEHAVVHRARQAGALGLGRGRALGRRHGHRGALERLGRRSR